MRERDQRAVPPHLAEGEHEHRHAARYVGRPTTAASQPAPNQRTDATRASRENARGGARLEGNDASDANDSFPRAAHLARNPIQPPLSALNRRALLPWFLLALVLALPWLLAPFGAPRSWLFATLAQAAVMIVFALSYNLLLGATGLLSLGHAVYAGLGALIAAQLFNRVGVALPLLPVVGGLGGAAAGAIFGFISTRRAGTAFAMITLGIGELVAAAAWTLPDWFGGEAGVPIDRTTGPSFGGIDFGPPSHAYLLIAFWSVVCCVLLRVLAGSPFMLLAKAVRDNPRRAAAIGCEPRRVRYGVSVIAAGFAGVAGTLGLINVELVATESVGMMRSGAVLIATVIGGTGAFFGPVIGAVVLTFFSIVVAGWTRAWLLYLGLLFVAIVVAAPDGIAGWMGRQRARGVRHGWWASAARVWLPGVIATGAWLVALVLAVQWLYAARFGADDGVAARWLAGFADSADASAAVANQVPWRLAATVFALAIVGAACTYRARRASQRMDAADRLRMQRVRDRATNDAKAMQANFPFAEIRQATEEKRTSSPATSTGPQTQRGNPDGAAR